MVATDRSLGRPPEGLGGEIGRRYGFGVGDLRPLEGGYANDVFRASSPLGDVVVRVSHHPEPEDTAWEHRAVAALAARLPEVPAPLAALDGTTSFLHGALAVSLLPFVEGRPADRGDERHRDEAARLLGRVHREASRLDLPLRPRCPPVTALPFPPVGGFPPAFDDLLGRIEDARGWAAAFVGRIAAERSRVTHVIHGDFFRGNVLVRDDRAVALVDWEEAHPDWAALELANGVWEFAKDGDDLGGDAARRFVRKYRAAGGTSPPEDDDLLIGLIRVRRITEVLRAPTDRHVDWDYQRHNLRAFDRLRTGW